MEQWQNVSNSLFQADALSIASLSGIVSNLAQTYGAESMELLSFNNSYVLNNVNIVDHTDSFPGVTFITEWETGTAFDVKTDFAWGWGENLAYGTYETTSIKFNPHIGLYGYAETWFNMSFEWFYFEIEFYFSPFDINVLDINIQIPNGNGGGLCTDISAKTNAVTMEVNTNWGWPNCSWGFFEHFFGWRVFPSWGGENGCNLKYFGNSHAIENTPAWKKTFLNAYDNKIVMLPQVCVLVSTPAVDAATEGEKTVVDEEVAPVGL